MGMPRPAMGGGCNPMAQQQTLGAICRVKGLGFTKWGLLLDRRTQRICRYRAIFFSPRRGFIRLRLNSVVFLVVVSPWVSDVPSWS